MKVRLFAAAAEAAGLEEHQLDGSMTLDALRGELRDLFGTEFTQILGRCAVLVDGARINDSDLVPATATVDVLPPFAGG